MLYFPILRTKQGELAALGDLTFDTKQSIRPILQIPPPDLTYSGDPVPPDEDYMRKVARALQATLAFDSNIHCFLDPGPAQLSPELIRVLLTAIAEHGGNPQPVYYLTGSEQHAALQAEIIGPPHSALLRVSIREVGIKLVPKLTEAMQRYQLRPEQTVLLLDMGDISLATTPIELYEQAFAKAVLDVQSLGLSNVVVASAALPAKSETPKWQWTDFTRLEATVFEHIKTETGIELHFGDYGVGNVITEPSASRPGVPKVRYSSAMGYHIMRGQKPGDTPHTATEQYQRLGESVVAHLHYSGNTFSWGDDYIFRASQPGTHARGNAGTWVRVNTSHHIELIASMLPAM